MTYLNDDKNSCMPRVGTEDTCDTLPGQANTSFSPSESLVNTHSQLSGGLTPRQLTQNLGLVNIKIHIKKTLYCN